MSEVNKPTLVGNTITNPYRNVLNVSSLFVLDSLLSAGIAGLTYSSSIHVSNLPI